MPSPVVSPYGRIDALHAVRAVSASSRISVAGL